MNKKPFFKRKSTRIVLIVLVLLVAGTAVTGYSIYKRVMLPNVTLKNKEESIYIRQEDHLTSITRMLTDSNILRDEKSFTWWANKRDLGNHIHAGHYIIQNNMSNRSLVNLLSSGRQTPVNVTFNNIRTRSDFAKRIGEQLEADSDQLAVFFDTTHLFAEWGFTKDNFMTLFIPNTYEFYWTTSVENFMLRMKKEHDAFWTEQRKTKAKNIGLTPTEVYVLASIVYSENEKASDEANRIAGVYMNRIKHHEKLEADPTVKFAIGDFAKKRIYLSDLEIDSPYNTYKYNGLPPGPIHMPPIVYIDAVLNYEKHEYKFMCARGDGSGYHYFAKTLAEHNQNRQLYIRALDKAGIY